MALRIVMSGPLGKDRNFALYVDGDYGVKEIDWIMRRLSMDREMLVEAEPSQTKETALKD